ncbi:MAG: hypothetical protein LBO66_09265 [Deltaproteobacteria bacterium]|jgi:hypothetical protein|nr:hypothetical protein [Deltaproteobacteria bacterium]
MPIAKETSMELPFSASLVGRRFRAFKRGAMDRRARGRAFRAYESLAPLRLALIAIFVNLNSFTLTLLSAFLKLRLPRARIMAARSFGSSILRASLASVFKKAAIFVINLNLGLLLFFRVSLYRCQCEERYKGTRFFAIYNILIGNYLSRALSGLKEQNLILSGEAQVASMVSRRFQQWNGRSQVSPRGA